MPLWHSALPETKVAGIAAGQEMRNSVFAGTLTQMVAPIHSCVVTSTFVFTVPVLSIRAGLVLAPRTLEKSKKWKNSLDQSPLEENVQSAPFTPPTSTNFSIPPLEDCPLHFHARDKELSDDPDRNFILDGLRFGFKLIPESDPSCIVGYEYDNYSSATCPDFKPEMDSLFTKELALGRISMVQTKPRCVHPIRPCTKKTQENPAQLLTAVIRMVFLWTIILSVT